MARFAKGSSGNPKGRPIGPQHQSKIMAALGGREGLNEIVGVVKAQALAGDMSAAAILLNRIIPQLKPQAEPVKLDIDAKASHGEMAEAALKGMASGQLSPTDGQVLLGAIETAAKLSTFKELEERISQLETRRK